MNFTDIFKGKNLIALIAAVIICVLLSVFGVPKVAIYVVMFALGCNNKNFAQWVEDKNTYSLKENILTHYLYS